MSVNCKNTRQAVVVKLSKEINHTAFKYMQMKGEVKVYTGLLVT